MESETPSSLNLASLSAGLLLLAKLPEYERRIAALESELAKLRGSKVEKLIPLGRKWATLKEAAAVLGVCTETVRSYIARKLLRRNLASRHILIPVEDVETFVGKVVL